MRSTFIAGVVVGLVWGHATAAHGQPYHWRACGYCPPWMSESQCCMWRHGPMPGEAYVPPAYRTRRGSGWQWERFRRDWRDRNWPGAW
jgi:hypothetical protein